MIFPWNRKLHLTNMFKWILYFHGWLNRFRRNIIYQNLPSFLLVTNVSGMFHFKISWFYKFNFQSILRIFQKYLIRSEFIMVNHGANSIVMFHRSFEYKVDEIWSSFAAICCELNIFFNNVMFKNFNRAFPRTKPNKMLFNNQKFPHNQRKLQTSFC